MKSLTTCLGKHEIESLKEMVCKNMFKYRHDEFFFRKRKIIGNVEFFIDGKIYGLFDRNHTVDFFWGKEDICDLFFKEIEEKEAISFCLDVKQIDFPMEKKIKDILLVNDQVDLYENGELQFTYKFLSGLVFVFDDIELGFEKATWMQELMYVHKGNAVLKDFRSQTEELNDWPEKQTSINTRKILHILDC